MKFALARIASLALLLCAGGGNGLSALAAPGAPVITNQPASQKVFVGDPVTFTVGVDGTAPFAYQWLRGGAEITGATAGSYTLSTTALGDDGAQFSVIVSNSFDSVTSAPAILMIDQGILATNSSFLVPINGAWRFNQTGADLGTAWTNAVYSDIAAGWSNGPGVFDAKAPPRTTIGGETVGTQLSFGAQPQVNNITNYYFRTYFSYSGSNVLSVTLRASILIDDGAAFYLNGQEVYRIGLAAGASAATYANRTVGDAGYEFFDVPASALVNGSNILAAEVHQVSTNSSDITFGLSLRADIVTRVRDNVAPVMISTIPATNSTVRSLDQIEVHFSEGVTGVDASDLLINNVPAAELILLGPDQYEFRFPAPPTGTVQVAWATNHGITDLSAAANPFAGGSFSYTLDPRAGFSDVRINEFMAANNNGIVDEDGDREDWLELFNGGSTAANLAGWYLTDSAQNLVKWQIPAVSLPAGGYLIVWASEKNRRVANAPLHTNFKLEKNGEYLALVLPDGSNVVSSFTPKYPAQFDDVSYGRDRIDPSILTYFSTPTPGALNSATGAGLGVGPEVRFSRKSGTFRTSFNLELSVPSSNFVVRYFLVTNAATAGSNNVPSGASPAYSGPIPIGLSTQVRARAYPVTAGYFPGPASSETYLQIDAGAAAFTSDLPVVIFHNFGGGIPPASVNSAGAVGVFMVFDTNNPTGLTSLTNPPALSSRAGAHVRGSSTESYDKRNLGIEFWTEVNRDNRDLDLLGMPADSDWVLYAPNQFDRNYLHNPLAMSLGRQMGHYASRTRFAELFLNTAGGMVTFPATITAGNYNGVYVVMEKIKASNHRLDIARLDAQDTNAVTITGGYVTKIDRNNDPDDVNFFTPGNWSSTTFPWITANHAGWNTQPIIFHDPDGTTISQRPVQRTWFINYISAFEAALTNPNTWTNPVTGYRAYIDEDQWVENHMLNIFTFNVDGYRLSGYFHKERDEAGRPGSGKLKQGPLWDFDRSQGTGSVDPRPFNPRQWKRPVAGDQGTDLFGNNDNTTGTRLGVRWWWQVFHDPDFWQRWVDRWQDLRDGGLWSTTNVTANIDRLANQVRQAQTRNAARWTAGNSVGTPESGAVSADGYTYTFSGTYQGEIDFLKQWWTDRLNFVETNFLRRPSFSSASGNVPTGQVIMVTVPNAKPGTVTYYTLDGTDPRLSGGAIAPYALSNTAPFSLTITQNVRLFARNRNSNHSNLTNASLTAIGGNPPLSTPWSGPSIATYVVATPPLRISEIMYDPFVAPGDTNDPSNYEYIELVNVSGDTLSLIGFRFTNGIDFRFTATNNVTSLAAGDRVLVVRNRTAFLSRYPGLATQVAGEFSGNLENAGERLALIGPLWEPIHDFRYENTWSPPTEGLGFSLVVVDENSATTSWTNAAQWRASAYNGGSPGAPDSMPVSVLPVLVNEVLTHSAAGVDAIELFNPNPTPVNVGDWYLTDNRSQPQKYRIPANTMISSNGYRVFYETNSFGMRGVTNAYGDTNGFAFNSAGEEVYLFSGDNAGRLTGYFQGFDFGPAGLGVSFGRYTNSVGTIMEVAQSANTLGSANAYPLVGPIVINEIMYFPPDLSSGGVPVDNFRDEFVELRNLTGTAVSLYDTNSPNNRWQLEEAVDFAFPVGASVPSNGYALVVSFDPVFEPDALAAFKARYGITNSVPIYGPFSGHLDNGGERLELRRPGDVNPSTGIAPLILVDRVDYMPTNPWPTITNGTGASMQRRVSSDFGNDPANWVAGAASAGRERVAGTPPSITMQPQSTTVGEEGTAMFSVGVSGTGPFLYQWFFNGAAIDGGYNATLVLTNVQPSQAGSYFVYVLNGSGDTSSSPATLTVRPIPVITQQPMGTNITLVSTSTVATLSLRVSAAGTGTLTYQWQRDGMNIVGATASMFTVNNVQPSDSGTYRVLVTDDNGTRTSQPAVVNVSLRAFVLEQPQPLTLAVGSVANFSVTPGGTPPFTYRWRFRAITISTGNVPNAVQSSVSNSVLSVTNVQLTNGGGFTVVLNNSGGQAVSGNANLIIVKPPTNQVVSTGTTVSLRAISGLPPTFTNAFLWLFGGNTLAAGTNTSTASQLFATNDLILTNVTEAQSGTYTFMITNLLGAPATFSASVLVGNADGDGDGIPDAWEFANGLDWNDPSDAGQDPDGDGLTNLEEYQAGTNPHDQGSVLKIVLLPTDPLAFEFMATSNKTYTVQYNETVQGGTWMDLMSFNAAPTNRVLAVTNAVAPGVGQQFFRVRTP